MTDNRCKNFTWGLNTNPNGSLPTDQCQLAVLMDIREELQGLRRIFECANFLGMPAVLREVAANTKKPKRRRKAKK